MMRPWPAPDGLPRARSRRVTSPLEPRTPCPATTYRVRASKVPDHLGGRGDVDRHRHRIAGHVANLSIRRSLSHSVAGCGLEVPPSPASSERRRVGRVEVRADQASPRRRAHGLDDRRHVVSISSPCRRGELETASAEVADRPCRRVLERVMTLQRISRFDGHVVPSSSHAIVWSASDRLAGRRHPGHRQVRSRASSRRRRRPLGR
jgi:hypothetical protein